MDDREKPETYLPRFFGALALERQLSLDQMRQAFVRPHIYDANPGMPELVARLLQQDHVRVTVLSDSISAVAAPVRKAMKRLYPFIPDDDVLISSDIGAAKVGDGRAYDYLMYHLGSPEPESVLFIDDRFDCLQNARRKGLRTHTFTDNPYGRDAITRLNDELHLGRLL